ncbi:50S ribosomal protein L5 [Candidatus Phycorickettsia trachydisci]|uniref:Large ribosomal subunit protein uL5 n=1 Tax=Candidatus Phycorickettsia trachydisci TaxID=2115978 RepID=A0A2P1P8X9_9RICK|nr:50S ribosomal protein L5 [Candidatus Phycorickettsia trachydisci]AVP87721.1 50S ribosomal protein L5 [Candidatus Phycorickettsia trachydisci]
MAEKRFKQVYFEDIIPRFKKEFGFDNIHAVPKIQKIVLNMGVGAAVSNSKALENATRDLALISGQKPCVTLAKKSIAGFKLREGMKIGCKVTLRGDRIYDFLERLVYVALPRVKNFKGFSVKNFDGSGNFNFGINDHSVFPEVKYDDVSLASGLNISIVTNSADNKSSKSLLSMLKFPFIN